MTTTTVQVTCPTCGEVTTHPYDPEGHVTQGLAMHGNLSGVARPKAGYRNSPHRSGKTPMVPQGIVVHNTAGRYDGAVGWFQNPASQVSAHFAVARDRRRVQMVPLPDPAPADPRDGSHKAWHGKAGNGVYLGIEHEYGYACATCPADWAEEMLDPSAELSAYLCALYGIPIDVPPDPDTRGWFTGFGRHRDVPGNDHTDPGPCFPWDYWVNRVEDDSSRLVESVPDVEFTKPTTPVYQTL
ncbi:N-acetylmuramoyl-L-alanine amidase [Streptomyces sp. C10-9-1]|uniref:N-acetylmuramoyl-L-alanine amidase n=1 Tax=Streptomyces sp. C10-9-1 TaxID=1859285 RepID=UPI0021135948|nr:peptidoglycan recognition family protein [Streptomyces sp. C10-9-1]MCQ6556834.1 N-acetylmuramoyl-L-alanine amidase [Streptomyces sp. C10-9-1]